MKIVTINLKKCHLPDDLAQHTFEWRTKSHVADSNIVGTGFDDDDMNIDAVHTWHTCTTLPLSQPIQTSGQKLIIIFSFRTSPLRPLLRWLQAYNHQSE